MLRRTILSLCLVLAAQGVGAQDRQIAWLAADLPPFGLQTDAGHKGFAHELVIAMATRLGRPPVVTYLPWARAVKHAEDGPNFGLFPLARTPEREPRFRWLARLHTMRYVLLVKASEPAQDLAQMKEKRIGLLRGSPHIKTLKGQGFAHLLEGKDLRELLRMLEVGTIQAIYSGGAMLNAAIDDYGFERTRYKVQATMGEGTLYLAASLGVSQSEAELWTRAFQALEADGTVDRLRQKYIH